MYLKPHSTICIENWLLFVLKKFVFSSVYTSRMTVLHTHAHIHVLHPEFVHNFMNNEYFFYLPVKFYTNTHMM